MYSSGRCATVDPLGFTKQTEIIVRGLIGDNGDNLLSEFKKWNISTEALRQLTKEDFIKLGVDDRNAEHMINELKVMQKNVKHRQTSHKERINDLFHIMKHGEQQLLVIQALMVYTRYQLKKKQINLFIDFDKNIRASEALYVGALATLDEINQAKQDAIWLGNLISKMTENSKDEAKSKYSCVKYSAVTTTIIVVAYTVLLTYRYYRRI